MGDAVCGVCLDTCNNAITLHCNHTFCYLCIKEALCSSLYSCPLCRKPLDDKLLSCGKSLSKKDEYVGGMWQYESKRKGEWWYFDATHCKDLDEGWEKYQDDGKSKTVNLTILGTSYEIDFENMMQTSLTTYGKRCIRRGGNAKGVAGMVFQDCFVEDM